ncbi:MAG: hypothetical protein WCG27_03565 [Pseudomonadota bacterium]
MPAKQTSIIRITLALAIVIVPLLTYFVLWPEYQVSRHRQHLAETRAYYAETGKYPDEDKYFAGDDQAILERLAKLSPEKIQEIHEEGLCFINWAVNQRRTALALKFMEQGLHKIPCWGGHNNLFEMLTYQVIGAGISGPILKELIIDPNDVKKYLYTAMNSPANLEAFKYIAEEVATYKDFIFDLRNGEAKPDFYRLRNSPPPEFKAYIDSKIKFPDFYEDIQKLFLDLPLATFNLGNGKFLAVGSTTLFRPQAVEQNKGIIITRGGKVSLRDIPSDLLAEKSIRPRSELQEEDPIEEDFDRVIIDPASDGDKDTWAKLRNLYCKNDYNPSVIRKIQNLIIVVCSQNLEVHKYRDTNLTHYKTVPPPVLKSLLLPGALRIKIDHQANVWAWAGETPIYQGQPANALALLSQTPNGFELDKTSSLTVLEGPVVYPRLAGFTMATPTQFKFVLSYRTSKKVSKEKKVSVECQGEICQVQNL